MKVIKMSLSFDNVVEVIELSELSEDVCVENVKIDCSDDIELGYNEFDDCVVVDDGDEGEWWFFDYEKYINCWIKVERVFDGGDDSVCIVDSVDGDVGELIIDDVGELRMLMMNGHVVNKIEYYIKFEMKSCN